MVSHSKYIDASKWLKYKKLKLVTQNHSLNYINYWTPLRSPVEDLAHTTPTKTKTKEKQQLLACQQHIDTQMAKHGAKVKQPGSKPSADLGKIHTKNTNDMRNAYQRPN